MSFKIEGLNHVALNVESIKESMAWYEKVFGFTVKDTGIFVPDVATGGTMEVAHMDCGGFDIEFFQVEGSQPAEEHYMYFRRRGNKHFAFNVPDRFIAKKAMEEMGIAVELLTNDSLFIRDNDGHLIELFDSERGVEV